ncbi:MAG: hypothetical protein ACK4ON_02095, partial [Bacteroidia bacterium]
MPKIITYNVNGIRAAMGKNWLDWLTAVNPDIVWHTSQETDSFALVFLDGGAGGISSTKYAIGEWHPLHPALSSATFLSFSAWGI